MGFPPPRENDDAVVVPRPAGALRVITASGISGGAGGDGNLPLQLLRLPGRLYGYRSLIWQLTLREIQGRYKGSYLGLFWSFVNPLVMLALYTFVFGVVFKARWPQARHSDSLVEFAMILFAGQAAFQLFSEPVGRASTLVVAVPAYVKKIIFPLEILPLPVIGAALFHFSITAAILFGFSLFVYGAPSWTILLLPLAILPLLLLTLGAVSVMAALGVYVRDVGYAVGMGLQVLFFATPIFYPLSAVPERFRWLALLNPLTPCVELIRSCLLSSGPPDPLLFLVGAGLGAASLVLGYGWFLYSRRGFADVI
jgi:lipopolysaccharide transport system permease protein